MHCLCNTTALARRDEGAFTDSLQADEQASGHDRIFSVGSQERPNRRHVVSRRLVIALVLALAVVPVALAGKPASPGNSNSQGVKTFTAKLRGANGMRGNVVVRLNASEKKVCWAFSSLKLNGKTAFAAHIHTKAGGAVLIPLGASPMPRRGCTTNVDWADEIAAVIAAPANYYVNVHEQTGLAVLVTGVLKKGAPAA
jgi:hypothetical protein